MSTPTEHTVLGQSIHPRLRRFTPTTLTTADWARLRQPVLELASRADPSDDEDAKHLAIVLCQLLAAELPERPDAEVAELLTEAAISRYVNRMRGRYATTTLQNKHARLTRLQRTLRKLPAPAGRQPKSSRSVHPEDWVVAVFAEAEQAPAPIESALRRRIALGVAAGLLDSAADGAVISTPPDGSAGARTADGWKPPLAPRYTGLLTQVDSDPVTDDGTWATARAWWGDRHSTWDRLALRDLWLREILTDQVPAVDLLPAARITRRDVDRVRAAIAGPLTPQDRAHLRG